MKRRATLIPAAVLVITGAACLPSNDKTVHVSGGTPFVSVQVWQGHGVLTRFAAYYQDGYVHGDIVPQPSNGPVTKLEHFTCVNFGPCGDYLANADPEQVGTLGQPHISINHNRAIDFHPRGQGSSLVWQTYEHLNHTELEFDYSDGFQLYVVLDQPVHLFDVQLSSTPNHSNAVQTAADVDG